MVGRCKGRVKPNVYTFRPANEHRAQNIWSIRCIDGESVPTLESVVTL